MRSTELTLHFSQMLITLLKAKVSLADALYILAGNGMEYPVKNYAAALLSSIKKGKKFSESLLTAGNNKIKYPPLYSKLIAMAELTGSIEPVLEHFISDLQKKLQLREKIINILIYPVLIIILAITGTIFLLLKGLPFFISEGFLSGTIIAEAVSGICTACLVLVLGGVFLFFIYYKIFCLDSPEFKIFYMLDLLLQGSFTLPDAISQCINAVRSSKYAKSLVLLKKDINSGLSFSKAITKIKFFSPYVSGWLSIAGVEGNIEEICANIKQFYSDRDTKFRETASRFLEPLIIILTGSYILIIIMTVILPILTHAGGII